MYAAVVLDVCYSCIGCMLQLYWMYAVVVLWLECVELMTVACTTDDATTYVVPLGKVACMI